MNDGVRSPTLIELVECHSALLYRYAYRLTGSAVEAEDLTQQTFLAAHAKFSQLREPAHAKSWLCSILRNAYLKNRRSTIDPDRLTWEPRDESTSDSILDGPFDEEDVRLVLNDLPDDFKIPLVLFYFQEMSYREIAEHLELPIGTVMSRLARAKVSVRMGLEQRNMQLTAGKTPPREMRS